MAKIYTEEEKINIINTMCDQIAEGKSMRTAIKESGISFSTFYIWLREDKERSKQYASACDVRAEVLFEEILDIADDTSSDKIYTQDGEKTNTEAINRSRLKVDSRKWYLSKVKPKKFGDKIDVTTDGETLNTNVPVDKWIKKKGSE